MTDTELSSFVERFTSGKVEREDFAKLTAAHWQEINSAVRARRQEHLQQYINALFALRMNQGRREVIFKRSYSEGEILAELEKPD